MKSKAVQKSIVIAEMYQEFDIIDYYKVNRSYKLKLHCKNCGYDFERFTQHFIESPHMCPKCHPKMIKQTITLEEAQRRINNVYGENYLTILEYKGNNTKVDIKCEKCSNIFQSVPVSLWRQRLRGCPYCEKTKSLGECRIERYLRLNKIQFRTQERFLQCKDKLCLPFDFYLPQLNTCIEFQGEQHYDKTNLLWSEELINHDNIKKQFCKEQGINLIEIPYYDIDNLDKYLKELKCE